MTLFHKVILSKKKKYATRFVKDRRKIGKTLHLNLLSRANGFCKDFLFIKGFPSEVYHERVATPDI